MLVVTVSEDEDDLEVDHMKDDVVEL